MNSPSAILLHEGIDNAIDQLDRAIPAYAAGRLTAPHDPHALGVLFRKLGVCRMLTQGTAEPLFLAQMQAVSAYLHRLPTMPAEHKVTSRAAVFWDAIGGEYWEAASEIAWQSRTTVNRTWEHPEDFLYVWFLMARYFRDAPIADDPNGRAQAELRQQELLDRWQAVLAGSHDPRLAVCEALLHGDAQAFRPAFDELADAREADLRWQVEQGVLPEDDVAWALPLWSEGLALLRLAERDGLAVDTHAKGVPQVARAPNPFAYDANAWRRVDFGPAPRP